MLCWPPRLASRLALAVALGACAGDDAVRDTGLRDTLDDLGEEVADTLADGDGAEDIADLADTAEVDTRTDTDDTGEVAADTDTDDTGEVAADTDTEVLGPRCGDGATDPGEACDDGNDDDLDGCTRACELGPEVRHPRAGEIVITEIMVAPWAAPGRRGEWFEIESVAAERVNLSACRFADDGTDTIGLGFEGGLALDPGERLVFAAEPDPGRNGGVVVDVPYATMLFEDLADELALVCEGAIVDRVAWVPFVWPVVSGRTLSLDPSRLDVDDNDQVASWCSATTRYGLGDRGSPGEPNPSCPHLDTQIDRCRLVGPPLVEGFVDYPATFEVEVEELGLTDLTPLVDTSPRLVVEVGAGPVPEAGALDPEDLSGFTFTRARPRPGYLAAPGERSDRWVGDALGRSVGTLGVVARASRDGGATFTWCDLDGSLNGLGGSALARLEVGPTPCDAESCLNPPPSSCGPDGVTRLARAVPGACTPLSPTTFGCEYGIEAEACGATGRVCESDGDGARCGRSAAPPSAGEVVLSEIMIAPTASVDGPSGQWVELANLAGEPRLLTGCRLRHTPLGAPEEEVLVDAPLVIGNGGRVVLGASLDPQSNGGAPVSFAWGEALTLTATSTLTLSCEEDLDTVVWNATWPIVPGASLSLSPFVASAAGNDTAAAWCRAEPTFGAGDRGTPGDPNPRCPGDVVPVEACRVVGPARVTPPAGTQAEVDLRVLVRALTGRTVRTDPSPRLWLEVGVAPRGAGPAAVATWTRGVADTAWVSTGQGVDPAEDKYRATYRVPGVGAFDLHVRATADGGNTYAQCDPFGLVPSDGTARPQEVEPVASACDPDPCLDVGTTLCRAGDDGSPTRVFARRAPVVCALGGAGATCSYGEELVTDCAEVGARCGAPPLDGARCVDFPRPPTPGEVAISELMIAPLVGGVANENGEWIELTNTGDASLDLAGCALVSDGPAPERWELPAATTPLTWVLAPGEALTVARSANAGTNGGSAPSATWSGLTLDNAADRVALECEAGLIAEVSWDTSRGWPVVSGRSLLLSGSYLDFQDTRSPSYWCATAQPSPRQVNLTCPGDGVIDACRLLGDPDTASADDASTWDVLLFDPGVTDLRSSTDAAIGVVVEVGVGDPALDPRTSLAWTWYRAAPDPTWVDSALSDALGHDRWRATLTPTRPAELALPPADPTASADLAVMARVSHDGGQTFRVCGATGFSNAPAAGVELTLTPGLCAPNPCRTPPAATCSGNTIIGYSTPGLCTVSAGLANCQYASRTFSCSSWGGCAAGACVNPPPRPSAAGTLVITEVMRDSSLPAPDRGEWVEVKSTASTALDLRGCRFVTATASSPVIAAPVPELVNAGAHALFVQSTENNLNGGIPAFFAPLRPLGVELPYAVGSLRLECGGTPIDSLAWTLGWPGRPGVAMQLDRTRTSDTANDLRASWCEASSTYGSRGFSGSPASLNATCPAP